MKRVIQLTLAALVLVLLGAAIGPATARADTVNGITCNPYRYLFPNDSTSYPDDFATASQTDTTGHYYVCSLTLTHANAEAILSRVQTIPSGALGLLKQQSVYYYYFAKRSDANSYMSGKSPFSLFSQFQTSTARCGYTAYGIGANGATTIASEIFDVCSFSNGTTPPNPNLGGVILHESGHAFDFSVASNASNKSIPPSISAAFKSIVNGSNNSSTVASDFYYQNNGKTKHPKPTACTVYDSVSQSALELDIGGANDIGVPVCSGNTENSDFVGMTNTDIGFQQLPYFFNPPSLAYEELFAQEFAKLVGTIGSPDPLPLTDSVIQNGSLGCSRLAVTQYLNTLLPPTTAQLQASYCQTPSAGSWNQ